MLSEILGARGRAEEIGVVYSAGTNIDGTTVTTSSVANTFGTGWTTLGTTSFPYEWITVYIRGASAANHVFSIGIDDGAGNVFTIVDTLRYDAFKSANEWAVTYSIPVRVPEGARLVARAASSTASINTFITVCGYSRGLKGLRGYSRLVALTAQATSRGVTVDAGATANTYGTWTVLASSTSVSVDGLILYVGSVADTARATSSRGNIQIGIGASGQEALQGGALGFNYTTTSDRPMPNLVGPLPIQVPSGSRLVARAACTDATAGDRTVDIMAYGLVP